MQTASAARSHFAEQAKDDAKKRARDLQGLLDAANRAITELQATYVRTVYESCCVILWFFAVAVWY